MKKLVVSFLFFCFSSNEILAKDKLELLEIFNKVLYTVEKNYYREVKIEKLIEGAIKGMMETLDPHSSYLGEENLEQMRIETSGEFGGLGVEITMKDGIVIIISTLDGSPAHSVGILPGDKIVQIDGESILGLSLDSISLKMKGGGKKTISLGVLREGEEKIKNFKITKKKIQINPVKSKLLDGDTLYIRLTHFQKNSANEVSNAIKKLKREVKKNTEVMGIILDLRNNPGGLLEEAINVSSIFLERGVVVSTWPRDDSKKNYYFVNQKFDKEIQLPLVVLINGASASASEIVAGAIQDYKRGPIVGGRSFGKGSVQTLAEIDDKHAIKLTIAQYMTPKKRRIQAIGIGPDIYLEELKLNKSSSSFKVENFIRESDLKNHLSAVEETKEEKRRREENQRIKNKRKLRSLKEQKDVKNFENVAPEDDFQVIQAKNILKGLNFSK